MNLIPIFKPWNREELSKQLNLECGISEWVSIDFPYNISAEFDPDVEPGFMADNDSVSYETNRYDVTYHDSAMGKNLSVYVYMDEDSEKIIAIDSIVQDRDENVRYYLKDTPLSDIVNTISDKTA